MTSSNIYDGDTMDAWGL